MAELTLDQKRALALANARLRAQQAAAPAQAAQATPAPEQQSWLSGALDAFTQGATFGFGDNITAAEAALLGRKPGGGTFDLFNYDVPLGERYQRALEAERGQQAQFAEDNPVTSVAGNLAGGLASGVGIAGTGATLMRAGQSLPRAMGMGALEGMGYGGVAGIGYGDAETAGEAAADFATGAGTGAVLGGAAPAVIAGASSLGRTATGALGIGNQGRANQAVGEVLARSGQTSDDIARQLEAAQAAGQPQFMAVDAMGNPGQRMLSGVARTPGDARQRIYESLTRRQMGQGERLSSQLADAFEATDTAAQRAAALTAERQATANANYALAREGAGAIDVTPAIAAADDFLQPGATRLMNPAGNIADDSVEAAVRRARSYLTDGRAQVSDFQAGMRAKMELDAMIERASPSVQRQLIPIRNAVDDALEAASPNYAQARNTFREQSRAIEAVETGRAAASPRMRAADTIPQFERLSPEAQQAFRSGYVDPLIARIEAASVSPSTNKARMLMTEKTGQEFPAFAAPGRADRLGDQIAREQRMFETANAAIGGSRTADNLSDIADVAGFDPSTVMGFVQSPVRSAVMAALQRGGNLLQGRNERTRDMIARALMETDPAAARTMLDEALKKAEFSTGARAAILRALSGQGGGTAAQLN